MSPEQARGKDVDKRADIFAFGVVLYEMLTGERLFTGETISDTLAAVIRAEPDLTRVPVKVRRLLQRCLEKDERKRLRDIADGWALLEEEAAPAVGPPPPPARPNRTGWIAAGVLAAGLAVALVSWAPWRDSKPPDQPLMRLDVDLGTGVDIASAPGGGSRIILSPDGSRLVYMAQSRLYMRRLDQTSGVEMKGAEGAAAPFFSPDGKLKKLSVDGGAAVTLCEGAGSGSWGDDGNIIFQLSLGSGLAKIPASGGTPTALTKLVQGEATHRWPQVLPGSKAVLFTSHNATNFGFDSANVEVVSLKDGRRKVLQRGGTYGRYMPVASGTGYLLYANQATLFAVPFDPDKLEVRGTPIPVAQDVATGTGGAGQLDFSRAGNLVYRSGGIQTVNIRWLNADGTELALPAKSSDYRDVRVSPDGQRLALSIVEGGGSDIWVYEWQRDTMTRITFAGNNTNPIWTPDGRYLVFRVNGGMFWTRADGAGKPQPLTQIKNFQNPDSFTPDGTRLLFNEVDPIRNTDMWALPIKSDGAVLRADKPEVYLQTAFNEARASFSSDGRWLAYISDESGANEVYVRAFPDKGGKWQISNGGGNKPKWSRDGRNLIFETRRDLMAAGYTVKGDTFQPEKPRVWGTGEARDLVDWDLAPDGNRAVTLTRSLGGEQSPSRVTFLMNFADEVRRRTVQAK